MSMPRVIRYMLTLPTVLFRTLSLTTVLGAGMTCLFFVRSHASLRRSEDSDGFAYLDVLLKACGALCRLDTGSFAAGPYFAKRTVHVDCKAIFGEKVFIQQTHGEVEAPREIPERFRDAYTMNGRVSVSSHYVNEMYLSKTANVHIWSENLVNNWASLASAGNLDGNYGATTSNELAAALKFANGVRGGRVLVIGSESPWVEAIALSAGAAEIVTLEYGFIKSEHPSVQTMTPTEYQQNFFSGTLGAFDAIVTYSSVEHSGLGRYGDALNPWGDILEIARAHCVCKTHGTLIIAVPTTDSDDGLAFNAHRIYGSIRWPYLASNWQLITRGPRVPDTPEAWDQRIHVFMKL